MNDMQTSLDRYNKAVDTLIDALRKELEELREYRQRVTHQYFVVSDCLTGWTLDEETENAIALLKRVIMQTEDNERGENVN